MEELRGNMLDLFLGFRKSFSLSKMFLGFAGIAMTLIVMAVVGIAVMSFWLADEENFADPVVFPTGEARGLHQMVIVDSDSDALVATMKGTFNHVITAPTWYEVLIHVIGIFIIIYVWAWIAISISRMTAVDVARGDWISFDDAMNYAGKRIGSYWWAPVSCALVFTFLWLCCMFWGVVGQIPWFGPIFIALFTFLTIIAGMLMAVILVGGLSFPLFGAVIGCEGADAFETISRSYNYVLSKPWHYIWYNLVSVVYGAVTWAFVLFMAALTLACGFIPAKWAMGDKFGWFENFFRGMECKQDFLQTQLGDKAFGIQNQDWLGIMWQHQPDMVFFTIIAGIFVILFAGFAVGYIVSFIFSQSTIIYLLMRKAVDRTEMTEVFYEEDEEFSLEKFGIKEVTTEKKDDEKKDGDNDKKDDEKEEKNEEKKEEKKEPEKSDDKDEKKEDEEKKDEDK